VKIVGISGNLANPSRTVVLVEAILAKAAQNPRVGTSLINVADIAASLGGTLNPKQAPEDLAAAYKRLYTADVLVIGTPVYKASYTGLLKHFFDLIDPKELSGKAAILAATGGSDLHGLVLEHQLRPLLSFFGVHTIPTTIYAKDSDFSKIPETGGYRLDNPDIEQRIQSALSELWNGSNVQVAKSAA
jgi:FMN reductase